MACSGVVTLWVASAVPDLLNLAVAEDKLLAEAGVSFSVHAEIKSDVIWPKSIGQCAVLELDLALGHSGAPTIIVAKVDNAIANALVGAQLPVVVVTGDDVSVITGGQATGRGQVWGNHFRFRDRGGDNSWVESSFVWSPDLLHLKDQNKLRAEQQSLHQMSQDISADSKCKMGNRTYFQEVCPHGQDGYVGVSLKWPFQQLHV